MSKAIVSVKKFNPSNITFTEPRKLDSGGKSVYMNYAYDENTRKNLTIQVGSLRLPFNMSVYDKAGPDNLKYSMNLSLAGYDDPENDKVRSIFKMLSTLDDFMIDQGVANSKLWFKTSQTRDVVKAFYTPIVQWPKDQEGNKKSFPPTIKLQLRQKKANPNNEGSAEATGKFDLELYNEDGDEMRDIPLQEVLVKGSQVTCLMQCTGVWFAGSKFGLSWKAVQIRVDKMPDAIRGYSFQADDDEAAPVVSSSSRSAKVASPAPAPAPVNQNRYAALQSNEEEEDGEEEEDEDFRPAAKSVVAAVMPPAPAPAPVADDNAEDVNPIAIPGKKTVVTKKSVVKTATKK